MIISLLNQLPHVLASSLGGTTCAACFRLCSFYTTNLSAAGETDHRSVTCLTDERALACAASAPEPSVQQENLFAFIDSVMQQAVPPSAEERAEAAAAVSAAEPEASAAQSPAAARQPRLSMKMEAGLKYDRQVSLPHTMAPYSLHAWHRARCTLILPEQRS